MKKKVLAFLLILALLCSYAPLSLAGGYDPDGQITVTEPTKAQLIEKLEQTSDGDLIFDQDGVQTFLSGKLSGKKAVGSAAAIGFLNSYKSLFGIDDAAKELRQQKTIKSAIGDTVIRFDQLIDGIPVEGNALNVHFARDGSIVSVNGNFLKDRAITALGSGTITEADAVEIAKKQFTYDNLSNTPLVQRVILAKESKNYDTYKVNISYDEPTIGNYDIYVEVHTGKVVGTESNICFDSNASGTGVDVSGITRDLNILYENSSSSYLMVDLARLVDGIQTYDMNHSSRGYIVSSPTTSFNSENYKASVSAHYFAGAVYDFYKKLFNRNSLDGNGMAIVSLTHYGTNYNNAFWDGHRMVYGDGDGSRFTYLSGDLDVVGHEMTHAVVSHTAGLEYHTQSGALDESLADTFGVLIETYNEDNVGSGGTWTFDPADWAVGDAIYTPGIPGDALRSLKDPTLYGQPARMADYVNLPDTEDGDWGGVHTNSGIPNKAAFLIAQSIGMEKTAKVYYRALDLYMLSTTNFAGAKNCLVQSATDLYGADSNEVSVVSSAFLAVGVGVTSSNNAKLAGLTASKGTLSPTFDASVLSYTLNVDTPTNSVTLTAPTEQSGAGVAINGLVGKSRSFPVHAGSDTSVTITVTAPDGSTQNDYQVTIHPTFVPADGPKLSNLVFDSGTLSPQFDPFVFNYDLYVDNALQTVQLTVAKQDASSTVKISGVAGTSLSIPVSPGVTSTATIEVTSADGQSSSTYTVTLHPFYNGLTVRNIQSTYIANNGSSSADVVVLVDSSVVSSKSVTFNGSSIAWPTDGRFSSEGTYALATTRVDGIPFTFIFTIDKTPPIVTAIDKNGRAVTNNAIAYGDVNVTITETNVSRLTVYCNGYDSSWPTNGKFSPTGSSYTTTWYGVYVLDKAGNYAGLSFGLQKDVRSVSFYTTKGGTPFAVSIVEIGSRITAPAPPTQYGYTFGGWYKDSDCTAPWNFSTDVVSANVILYALWIRDFTVNFITQGGSYLSPIAVANGSHIPTPVGPTRSGYTFGGWYKDSTCTLPWNFTADVVTADTTLYALWIPGAVQVHFNTQGGSGVADITASVNSLISAPPAPSRPGYNFTGWFQDSGCTLPWNFTANTVTTDRTLFAGWVAQTPSNYLYGIGLSAGGLNRGFSTGVTGYTINLGENDPAVTISPTKAYDGATMTIDGKAVPAKTIALANGKSANVTIKVTLGKKSTTYKLKVQRAKSTSNALAALSASGGSWSQPFDPAVTTYTLALPENMGKVSLNAVRASGLATVSPAKGSFTLKNGQTVKATFKVKAQSGATRTYTVLITRARSTNANLGSLKLSARGMAPGFHPAVADYAITLPAKTAAVTIAAKAADKLSTVRINGAKKASLAVKLANGQTTAVTVTVTAQSGDVKTYTIAVSRQ